MDVNPVRIAFAVLRSVGYASVFCILLFLRHRLSWWQWGISLPVMAWGSFDQWKRPDAARSVMRRGILVETALIGMWSAALQDASVIPFILISPAARGLVHLRPRDIAWMAPLALLPLLVLHALFPANSATLAWQLAILLVMGSYSAILGGLLRKRDLLRRMVIIDAYAKEQRAKDDERSRVAAQFHDTAGQYWAAVIRALDAALVLDGERREEFVRKAREAAILGLRETREAVHGWNMGRQSAAAWLSAAETSLRNLSHLAGIGMTFHLATVAWRGHGAADQVGELIARVMMEGTTNAIRHGMAKSVQISLRQEDGWFHVVVQDDGEGLDRAASLQAGAGIANLTREARRLGGQLQISSQAGRGTALVLHVPEPAQAGKEGRTS